MKKKYLILSIVLPLLVLAILFYLDNPSVTGAATGADSDTTKLGNYSILPSFKASVDYPMQAEYSSLQSRLNYTISQCMKRNDIEECMQSMSNEFGWGCQSGEEDILNDFVNNLLDCRSLKEESAVCRFSLSSNASLNKDKSERRFEIKLTDLYEQANVELKENGKVLASQVVNLGGLLYTEFDDRDTSANGLIEASIGVKYKDGKPEVEKFDGTAENLSNPKLSRIFLAYKVNGRVKFVDESTESSFRSPLPANNIIDLPKTRGMKFCAKSQSKVYAYDESDKAVKLRNVVYRFAVTFPAPAPKPVTGIEIRDALMAEDSAIIVWDKLIEPNVRSYTIYYSQDSFIDIKTSDLKKDESTRKTFVDATNPMAFEDISLDDCTMDSAGTPCKYGIYDNQLLKNKLYYWAGKNKFIYVIPDAKDGSAFNFAVTAVTLDGDEIDNDKTIKGNTHVLSAGSNYRTFTPKDDLPPGKVSGLKVHSSEEKKAVISWEKPSKNIDGSPNEDLKWFKLYFRKSSLFSGFDIKDASVPNVYLTLQQAGCEGLAEAQCQYALEGLDSGDDYRFSLTAIDENSNEYNENVDIITAAIK